MNYIYYFIVGAVIIFNLVTYIFRKNKVGNILESIRTSNGQFISEIIFGLIFLMMDGYFLYLEVVVDHEPIKISTHSLMFIGIIMLINAGTSNTFIGGKGISFATMPFYIPLNKISGYVIEDGKLILNRFNMADYRIAINIADSNRIINVMDQLKIENKCK
ncbi:hypothetical protein [Clostridium sp. C2-6-12]|uniref:hypothetical protein n=1 Tax=Clostridium sp. C2-6-12 TaxID=2698832 RepID=UPI00137045AB|nr:hypothetical protein [Clostridium sp. C2-6-12]